MPSAIDVFNSYLPFHIAYDIEHYMSIKKDEVREWLNFVGLNHSYHRSSYLSYYPDGTVFVERWFCHGRSHRLNGPAYIKYYNTGQILEEEWTQNNISFRTNGPFHTIYYDNKQKEKESWNTEYSLHRCHRTDAPAQIYYDENGSIYKRKWFLYGMLQQYATLEYTVTFHPDLTISLTFHPRNDIFSSHLQKIRSIIDKYMLDKPYNYH